MSLTGIQVAKLVKDNRFEVLKNLSRVVPDIMLRRKIVNEIMETKHYIRYNEAMSKLGTLGIKLCIIAIYEAVNEPDQAIVEIEKYMYS